MNQRIPRIAITPGEPAGIGPDVLIGIAAEAWPAELVAIADPGMLAERAGLLGARIDVVEFDERADPAPGEPGRLLVARQDLAVAARPGRPDKANVAGVMESLRQACAGCMEGRFQAMVTGPVHKGVIIEAGIPFSGHTEYLAAQTGVTQPVMLLVAGELRVALLTTHLALRDVPDQITQPRVRRVIEILHTGLRELFGIKTPRIMVLGLNPHAGESGHLGTEEQEVIEPVLEALRSKGMQLIGPMPADAAFTPPYLSAADAVLAMYHDQGLPVLKHQGFDQAVNVTLGLPVVRTSVGHGTAFELAGTGRASSDSMSAAVNLAIDLQARQA